MIATEIKPPVVTVERNLSPYMVGVLDAQDGYPFAPEEYFFWYGQMLEYVAGWESVKGESEITRAFLARWPEREEAIEDDHDFIRFGGAR